MQEEQKRLAHMHADSTDEDEGKSENSQATDEIKVVKNVFNMSFQNNSPKDSELVEAMT